MKRVIHSFTPLYVNVNVNLGSEDLADEGEIAAAVEVARTDGPQWRAA